MPSENESSMTSSLPSDITVEKVNNFTSFL